MSVKGAVVGTDEMQGGTEDIRDDAEAKQKAAMEELKQAISVEMKEIGPLRLKLTVSVPRETIDKRMGEQFGELRRDALIPGFRKGHAPVRLVEKRFASEVGDQLKTQLITNGYLAAVERESLKTLGDPLFFVKTRKEDGDGAARAEEWVDKLMPVDQALDHLEFPKEGPLSFSCEVELRPDFELPNLDKIPVKRPRVEITEKDLDEELRRLRLREGVFKPVEGGTVQRDDMLYVDTRMTADSEVIFEEKSTDLPARDVVLKGIPLRGLGEVLTGKNREDVVTLEATAPDDHENLAIRGKTVRCEFVIREIKRLDVPPVDDEFARKTGFESLAELREMVRQRVQENVDQAIREGMHGQIAHYLIEQTSMQVPTRLSERQANRVIARHAIELLQRGVPETEVRRVVDEMRVKTQERTIREAKLAFILEKIAEEQEIEVPEEEVNGEIARMAARAGKRFDRMRDELLQSDELSSVYLRLREHKVFENLLARAEITETEGPKT